MKILLLTSDGLSSRKLLKVARGLLEKPAKETRVLIMHTLLKPSYIKYVRKIKRELRRLGIPKKNIICANISNNIRAPKGIFDVFYSCGGNTFYILDRARKTGFDKVIKKFIAQGKFYIGVSAGSILIHKTIELAGWGSQADSNDINLKNLRGLNITNLAVYPHFEEKIRDEIKDFKKKVKYPIITIKDGQALLIKDKRKNLIK